MTVGQHLRLPEETVQALALEVFQTQLDKDLSNLV